MSKRRVALLGGTGFVGTELASRLAACVDEVVILTRRRVRVNQVRVLPNVTTLQVDTHDDSALNDALAGMDAVINLVGILNESGSSSSSFSAAHDQFTQRVLRAVAVNDVPRYLQMSALGADAKNGSSEYLRSKGRAEDHVRSAPETIAWTIFRPSVIFGRNDSFFNRFAGLLQLAPIFPLACPDARMAPVYVGDVCNTMVAALDEPATVGETVELCGPDILTLREIVEYTAKTRGLKRTIIGHAGFRLADAGKDVGHGAR